MGDSIQSFNPTLLPPSVDSAETTIFDYVQRSLDLHPATRDLIHDFCLYPIHPRVDSEKVLCIRSQDVLTTLLQFCNGKMQASDSTSEGAQVISKGHPGHIWTTANFANTTFDAEGVLDGYLPDRTERSFAQAIRNNADYGSQISFGTAILRNLVPKYFPKDWITKAHGALLGSARVSDWETTPGEVAEGAFSFLHEYCSFLKQGLNGQIGSYGDELLRVVFPEKTLRQKFINEMMPYHEQRSGMQIFFRNELLRYANRVYTKDVALLLPAEERFECTADELVIEPKNGFIPLNAETVLAILPLGDYEFDIMSQLGFEV